MSRRMVAPEPLLARGRGGGSGVGGGPLWNQQGRRRSSCSGGSGAGGANGPPAQRPCPNIPITSSVLSAWNLSGAVPRPMDNAAGGGVTPSLAEFSFPDLKLPSTMSPPIIPMDRGLTPRSPARCHESAPVMLALNPELNRRRHKLSSDGENDEDHVPIASLVSFSSVGGRPPLAKSHTFDEARLAQLRAHALAESAKLVGSESSDWTRAKAPQLLQPSAHVVSTGSGGSSVQASGVPRQISRRASLGPGSPISGNDVAVSGGISGSVSQQSNTSHGVSRRFSLGPGALGSPGID